MQVLSPIVYFFPRECFFHPLNFRFPKSSPAPFWKYSFQNCQEQNFPKLQGKFLSLTPKFKTMFFSGIFPVLMRFSALRGNFFLDRFTESRSKKFWFHELLWSNNLKICDVIHWNSNLLVKLKAVSLK